MGKRALVSGGAGFIGSHLCDCLVEQGWAVRVLDNFSTGSRDNLGGSVEALEGDITDPAACATACVGVDTVFHLAARVTIRQSVETFQEDAQTNLMGTLNLLRAAGEKGVRRPTRLDQFKGRLRRFARGKTCRREPFPQAHEPLRNQQACSRTSTSA